MASGTIKAVASKADISALNDQLTSLGSTNSTITWVANRAEYKTGGVYSAGNLIVIEATFKSLSTATNSPQIATTSANPVADMALSCIDITSGISSAITGAIPCGISSNGKVYIKEMTIDHIYSISGVFTKQ